MFIDIAHHADRPARPHSFCRCHAGRLYLGGAGPRAGRVQDLPESAPGLRAARHGGCGACGHRDRRFVLSCGTAGVLHRAARRHLAAHCPPIRDDLAGPGAMEQPGRPERDRGRSGAARCSATRYVASRRGNRARYFCPVAASRDHGAELCRHAAGACSPGHGAAARSNSCEALGGRCSAARSCHPRQPTALGACGHGQQSDHSHARRHRLVMAGQRQDHSGLQWHDEQRHRYCGQSGRPGVCRGGGSGGVCGLGIARLRQADHHQAQRRLHQRVRPQQRHAGERKRNREARTEDRRDGFDRCPTR